MVKDTREAIQMLRVQAHRGPDDAGLITFSLLNGQVDEHHSQKPESCTLSEGWLGFNRLSIQDVSQNGHQPMKSPDGQVWIIFNGEIYNVEELRPGLLEKGVRFKGHSDTEVILHHYLQHGLDATLKALNGMFAIALIDLRDKKMHLIRDRFGIKPLYFMECRGGVAFASELKSLLQLDGVEPRLDTRRINEYLLFRNTREHTLFKGIGSVLPGTYVTFSPGSSPKVTGYFHVSQLHRSPAGPSGTLADELRASIEKAVIRQLISDVRLGCQLSGGIDSSLVTKLAAQKQEDMATVSIVFEDPAFSEEKYVRRVTETVPVRAHTYTLDVEYYSASFEQATWHFEAPLNHPNTIGLFLLSEKAKEHVTVLLSGEGADEVFAGYSRFSRVLHPFNPRAIYSYYRTHGSSGSVQFPYFNTAYRTIFSSAFMAPVLAGELYRDFDGESGVSERKSTYDRLTGHDLDKHIHYEMLTYLPDLLHRQDTMSMAHGIENRVPFLDHELVKKAFQLPHHYLTGKGGIRNTKFILKEMAAENWGMDFAYRNKSGFGIPLRQFIRHPALNAQFRTLLSSLTSRGLFNEKLIHSWLDRIDTISSRELDALWIMMSFESWCRKFNVLV